MPRFFADLIGEWIDAKGLDLNKWAVAHTIIHKGSKLYRDGGRADVYSPELQKTIDRIGDRITYVISLVNTGATTLTDLVVTDDLGATSTQ